MTRAGTFRAFRNRNYTLYFCGQTVSLIGTWMQRTGVAWVVYSLTNSTFMVGLTFFAQQIPSSLLSLYGGIISDRYNRHKVLLITQTASMIQAILLAALVLSGHYFIWEILVLSCVLGVINAFDVPARQPLVHLLVHDKEDLPNALALNSSMVNMARVFSPTLAGFVLHNFGAGICFLSNAFSFMAVLGSLLLLKLPAYTPPPVRKKIRTELKEGLHYLKHTPILRITLLLLALVSFLVLPFSDTLLPAFAKDVFKGDAATFGYIGSFMGLGAISGTLFLASLKKGTDLKVILLVNTLILGIGVIAFSHITYFPLAMVFAVIAGFGAMSQNTICITILQVNAAKHMLGRVMSYMALAFFGMLPLGSLLVGYVSERIGVQDTMLYEGIIAVIIALVFWRYMTSDKLNQQEIDQLKDVEDITIKEI